MKKAILAGSITGLGAFLAIIAGAQKPGLSWTECALIAGITLVVSGMTALFHELKGTFVAVLACFLILPATAHAETQPVKITAYCLDGVTASGEHTRPGICAYRREDLGKLARIYDADGELLGEFLIADTGRKGGAVRKGLAVDIWKPTREECFQTTQEGFIEILEKEAIAE